MSHDATTYMDYLPLHKKNQKNKMAQYLCNSNDESVTKNDISKIGYTWPQVNPEEDEKMAKEKDKSIDLMEDSEEAAIRSCHKEPTRRNIVIVIACIKTL